MEQKWRYKTILNKSEKELNAKANKSSKLEFSELTFTFWVFVLEFDLG